MIILSHFLLGVVGAMVFYPPSNVGWLTAMAVLFGVFVAPVVVVDFWLTERDSRC